MLDVVNVLIKQHKNYCITFFKKNWPVLKNLVFVPMDFIFYFKKGFPRLPMGSSVQ